MLEALHICWTFILAAVLSGAIGMERQLKGHPAGLRTHVLVCLGATLAMVVSDEIAREWNQAGAPVWLDRGRIAAGIITGIGFLGGGAIINVGSVHRGLTTAAMIWLAATIGIAVGAGYYLIATYATGLALAAVIGLEHLEKRLPVYERLTVTLRMPKGLEKLRDVEKALRDKGLSVTASRIKIVTDDNERVEMTFELTGSAGPDIEELAALLRAHFTSAERITFER